MAVDNKQPLNQTITGIGTPTANGTPAVGVKRKRPSSLLAVANTLPSVENSLEEFIAKANQTLVDVGNWGTDKVKEQEDEKRKEIDALRWKAAETQLRESEVREGTLRRQLDNLQGKLAETEARAAVAAESGQHSPADDSMMRELRLQIARAEEKAASADMRARTLSDSLQEARNSRPALPPIEAADTMSDDRVRHAEAKAAKALAAARAIQAGLNVSTADLAAIESGLVVPEQQQKKTPWLAIAGAFVVGIAIMFVVTKLVMKDPAPAATPTVAAPAPAAAPAPTPTPVAPVAAAPAPVAKPIVTPIEDPKPEDQPPIAVAPAPAPTPTPAKVAPAPVAHHAAPATHAAPAPAHATAPAAKKPPAAASNIADPFAEPAKKAPSPPAKKPAAGAIADPF